MYTKTEWKTNDTITADKLNHIENGIADFYNAGQSNILMSIEVVTSVDEFGNISKYTLSKTFNEIVDAMNSGKWCYIYYTNANSNVALSISIEDAHYDSSEETNVIYLTSGFLGGYMFTTTNADSNPECAPQ